MSRIGGLYLKNNNEAKIRQLEEINKEYFCNKKKEKIEKCFINVKIAYQDYFTAYPLVSLQSLWAIELLVDDQT
jgi:hypothetical protein